MLKLEKFKEDWFDMILRNDNRKAQGLKEISHKVWKTRKFDNILRLMNPGYKESRIETRSKRCILSFAKKDSLVVN